MKTNFLLLFSFFSISIYAQEFARPDSTVIPQNYIVAVEISCEGKILLTLKYDTLGRCVYQRSENKSYYSTYQFNAFGKRVRENYFNLPSDSADGSCTFEYYPDGKLQNWNICLSDSVRHVMKFDSNGRVIGRENYAGSICKSFEKEDYDSIGFCIDYLDSTWSVRERDSSSGKWSIETKEWKNEKMYRVCSYNQSGEHWFNTYIYDSLNHLTKINLRDSLQYNKKFVSKTFDYFFVDDTLSKITCNGKLLKGKQRLYMNYDILYPEIFPEWMDLRGRKPEPHYTHTLTRDKSGNIIRDTVTIEGDHWFGPVIYTYSYTKLNSGN